MKKCYTSIIFILSASAAILLYWLAFKPAQNQDVGPPVLIKNAHPANNNTPASPLSNALSDLFQPPLVRSGDRVTKKPFGIFITPQTSPIQPERFRGYHTGADFEIFPDELDTDVTVRAVCDGSIIQRARINGYGGVVAQSCRLNGETITVLYGHMRLASVQPGVGVTVKTGDKLGLLGSDKSAETDGERKHLHLSFYHGADLKVRGYVTTAAELSGWADPCLYVCYND